MYTKLLVFLFAAAVLLQTSLVHAEEEYEEDRLYALSYNDFRLLRPERQIEYIELMQEFTVQLVAKGVEVTGPFDGFSVSSKWEMFISFLQASAEAGREDCSKIEFSYNDGKIYYRRSNYKDSKPFTNSSNYFAKECPAEFNAFVSQNQKDQAPEAITKFNSSIEKISPGSTKRTERNRFGQDIDPDTAQGTGTEIDRKPAEEIAKKPEDDKKSTEAEQKAVGAGKNSTDKLRCIYAGFTIVGKDCRPRKQYEDPKTKKVYTCNDPRLKPVAKKDDTKKPAEAADKKEVKAEKPASTPKLAKEYVLPEPVDAKKNILCNPTLFGLIDNKPICLAGGKDVTKRCEAAAKKDPKTLEAAVELAKNDPKAYDTMKKTVESLCDGKDDYLKEFKDSSKDDLKSTCLAYVTRFSEFQVKRNGSGSSSGARRGAN